MEQAVLGHRGRQVPEVQGQRLPHPGGLEAQEGDCRGGIKPAGQPADLAPIPLGTTVWGGSSLPPHSRPHGYQPHPFRDQGCPRTAEWADAWGQDLAAGGPSSPDPRKGPLVKPGPAPQQPGSHAPSCRCMTVSWRLCQPSKACRTSARPSNSTRNSPSQTALWSESSRWVSSPA